MRAPVVIYPGRFVGAVPDPAAPKNVLVGAVPDSAAPINEFAGVVPDLAAPINIFCILLNI